ncbi:hypothetical protein XELAEV_18043127mg [Xenopus laevis]|uniref:IF rod domain-containing protein n=1 Tax=Xenopus laevis TaxID=8355 RepID=A0A974H243_XENLA|nr:hypothetical protein XELAEV_18043127mg [Xenopus laevis]
MPYGAFKQTVKLGQYGSAVGCSYGVGAGFGFGGGAGYGGGFATDGSAVGGGYGGGYSGGAGGQMSISTVNKKETMQNLNDHHHSNQRKRSNFITMRQWLAADDFKQKYVNEHVLRVAVEADINGLHRVKDDLTMSKSDLQSQLDGLTEELAFLKKNHDDEVKAIKAPEADKVSVEMNAVPANDLNDMRDRYEEPETSRSADLKKKIDQRQTTIVESNTEVTTLKCTLQALQIELQSQLAQKKSLEMLLAETEGKFCMKLSHIQETIASLEESLAQLRADSERQKDEYQQLLDMKTKLEKEIKIYQSLMDKLDKQDDS